MSQEELLEESLSRYFDDLGEIAGHPIFKGLNLFYTLRDKMCKRFEEKGKTLHVEWQQETRHHKVKIL